MRSMYLRLISHYISETVHNCTGRSRQALKLDWSQHQHQQRMHHSLLICRWYCRYGRIYGKLWHHPQKSQQGILNSEFINQHGPNECRIKWLCHFATVLTTSTVVNMILEVFNRYVYLRQIIQLGRYIFKIENSREIQTGGAVFG